MEKNEPSIDEAYRPTTAIAPSVMRWQIPVAILVLLVCAFTVVVGIRYFYAAKRDFSGTRRGYTVDVPFDSKGSLPPLPESPYTVQTTNP